MRQCYFAMIGGIFEILFVILTDVNNSEKIIYVRYIKRYGCLNENG